MLFLTFPNASEIGGLGIDLTGFRVVVFSFRERRLTPRLLEDLVIRLLFGLRLGYLPLVLLLHHFNSLD